MKNYSKSFDLKENKCSFKVTTINGKDYFEEIILGGKIPDAFTITGVNFLNINEVLITLKGGNASSDERDLFKSPPQNFEVNVELGTPKPPASASLEVEFLWNCYDDGSQCAMPKTTGGSILV